MAEAVPRPNRFGSKMIIEASQFNAGLTALTSESSFNPQAWRQFLYAAVNFVLSQPSDNWESILIPLRDAISNCPDEPIRRELASLLVDVVWVVDLGCDSAPGTASTENVAALSPDRQLLAKLLNYLFQLGLAPPTMAKERLEPDLLEAAKAIQSAALFTKKQVRINTAMHYKQQKFNLMREEPEGYSKLVCLLLNAKADDDPLSIYEQAIAFIGYFDLDPIRVLDVILDAFAFAADVKGGLFIALLKRFDFPIPTVSSILGFKLKFLSTLTGEPALDGVMLVTAWLLKHGILDLEHVFGHLHPSNEACEEAVKKRTSEIMAASKKVGIVSLASKPADSKDATDIPSSSLGYQDVPLALRGFDVEGNQKVILLAKLIAIREVDLARRVMGEIPHAFALSTVVFREICGLIDELIEPAYASVRANGTPSHSVNALHLLNDWFKGCGYGLYTDPLLITKLCRLSVNMVSNDESVRDNVLNLVLNYLLPAVSLNTANPALANELWSLLQLFPYQTRFTLYYQWRNSVYDTCAELRYCRAVSVNDIRRVMRRLAKENVKQFGRLIGKMTHANPTIVFPVILDQLQSYDNLIQPVIDSFKYLTPLGYDILTYTLIEGLSNPEKDRLKEDGGSLAGWLQNLALFAGLFFKKYPGVDLSPVIAYIYAQLNDDNTLDLVVLSELLQKMAGLESAANLTDQELEAQAGGPVLRAEIAQRQNRNVAAAKGHRKPAQRLLAALVQSSKAVPLWIALGKLAFAAVYKTDIGHLKLLGLLTDQCHDVLVQYSEFFAPHAAVNGLGVGALPSVHALREMGVELDYAFYMRRVWERSHVDKSNLELLIAELAKGIPSSTLLASCPNLCLTSTVLEAFWRLELQDLWVPTGIYEGEIARFKAISGATEAPLLASEADKAQWVKDKERAAKVISSLEAELTLRRGVVRLVESWLAANKAALFAPSGSRTDIIAQLLHFCVLPRALFSPSDAIYAAKFLHSLHMLGAPNYSSLSCYDRIINGVAAQLAILTEKEAHCYGRFLNEVLALLARWHGSKEFYEAEAVGEGRPGFLQKWSHNSNSSKKAAEDEVKEEAEMRMESPAPSAMMMMMEIDSPAVADIPAMIDSPAAVMDSPAVVDSTASLPDDLSSSVPAQSNNPLTYEDFRHVMYKWHLKLYRALLAAFQEAEYMPTRNAIILLSRTTAFFPALRKIGGSLERAIAKVAQEEEGRREDLRLLATRLAAMFAAQKGRWVAESVFHRVPPSEAVAEASLGVEASPKRSSAGAIGGDLESKVKRMRLEAAGEVDSNRSHSQTPVSSKEEAERELRRKLEERKRATESAAATASSSSIPSSSKPVTKEKGKEKEASSTASAPKQSPTKGSRREAASSKDTGTSSGNRESSSRSSAAAPATAPPPPSSYSNPPPQSSSSSSSRQRPSSSDRDQHLRPDRYRDQDRRSSRR